MIITKKRFGFKLHPVATMGVIIALSIFMICSNVSGAERYPSKPIRLIVPFSPGGGSDNIARMFQPGISKELGQQLVVENKPGGNTIIGTSVVANAQPDGHTLLLSNANFTINAAVEKKLPYDPIKDFMAISPLASSANVLVVNSSVPAKSLKELVSLMKAKPGALNFASPGAGTSSALGGILLRSMANVDFTMVQYKGAGAAIADLLGGHVQMGIASMSVMVPHIKTGKLRALGVTTAQRSTLLPEVPTIAEAGIPGYEVSNWFGILSRKGISEANVKTLHEAFRKITEDAETKKKLALEGTEPLIMSPEEFQKFIELEIFKWKKLGEQFSLGAN